MSVTLTVRPFRAVWCAAVVVAALVLVHFGHGYWAVGVASVGLGIDGK